MLRGLVLAFALLNAALFFWMRSDPHWMQADREPQRLDRQVAPDAIQVLPDLPGASGAGNATSTTIDYGGAPATAASAGGVMGAGTASKPASGASGPTGPLAGRVKVAETTGFLHKTSEADLECAESGPLDDTQMVALKAALVHAGVPADAIAERRQQQPGSWIVYLGRYADAQSWQQKADELKRLAVKFERVSTPAALAPGLSMGTFDTPTDATVRLNDLFKKGVRAARVVQATTPGIVRRLQVRAADPAWRLAAGVQRFSTCSVETAAAAP